MRRKIFLRFQLLATLLVAAGYVLPAAAQSLPQHKVDLSITNRGDDETLQPGYTVWRVAQGKTDSKVIDNVTYTLSSPRNQVQPIYSNQEYAKPGDSLNYRIPVIIDVENKKVIEPSTELFHSQYSVSRPEWDGNDQTLTFEFNERGHKHYRILEMDLEGNVRTLIEEANDKYVAYSRNLRRDFDGGNKILWKSDRDGHAHLYIYDRKKDKLTQVTKGDFWVRDVQRIDFEEGKSKGVIYFSANGMGYKNMGTVQSSFDGPIPQEDPYNVHYYRIDTNGKNLVCLTPEAGNHKVTYTNDYSSLIDTYSSVDKAPVTVLRSAKDGKIIFKTDNKGLFDYSLESFAENGFAVSEVCFDLHSDPVFSVDNIKTEYEMNFSAKGFLINRLVAQVREEK